MMNTLALQNAWNSVARIGITGESYRKDRIISLLNQASVLTVFTILFYIAINYVTVQSWTYILVAVTIGFLYAMVLLLHALGYSQTSKYYITLVIPIWFAVWQIWVGGFFSQSLISATLLTIAYSLFDDEPIKRSLIIAYNILLHILALVYLSFYEPIGGFIDFPFDEAIVYLSCLIWLGLIIKAYVDDIKKLFKKIDKKNKKLKHMTEELKQFNYIASHDLKSPVRNIMSFLGLIESKLMRESYDTVLADIQTAKDSSKEIYAMINDILELSKLNAESSEDMHKFISLKDVANKAVANLHTEINEKNADVEIGQLPSYLANSTEFLTVFQNLIQNGIKYNESEQPKIKVTAEVGPEELEIKLQDNGIGINPEYHEEVFVFFKRLHNNHRYKGSGLGLSICRKIIQKYNGQLLLESAEGRGSVFKIVLPVYSN